MDRLDRLNIKGANSRVDMGRFGYPTTLLAASVIFYDMLTTYIGVEIYGWLELNPLYYVVGYFGLLLLNILTVTIIYALEYFSSKIPKWPLFRLVIIYAVVFRISLVLSIQITSFWISSGGAVSVL